MTEKSPLQNHDDETIALNRRFKYAVMIFAFVEFLVIALVFIYKASQGRPH